MDRSDTDIRVLGNILHVGRVSRRGVGPLWSGRRWGPGCIRAGPQRVKRQFGIRDASFLLLRGSVIMLKKGRGGSPNQPPGWLDEPCVRGRAWPCTTLAGAVWKERVNRQHGAGCAATNSAMWDKGQVPPHQWHIPPLRCERLRSPQRGPPHPPPPPTPPVHGAVEM